jgi:hypothetical protein
MGKKIGIMAVLVLLLLVLGACAGLPVVIFDENLPKEESAHLYFYYGLHITAYNGIPVPQKNVLGGSYSTWQDVYLPPGEMEFMTHVLRELGNYSYSAKDVFFKYKFYAGKFYAIIFTPFGGPNEDEWGVRLYDSPLPQFGEPKKETFIAFLPFYRYKD